MGEVVSRPNVHQVVARVERHHRLIESLRSSAPRWLSGAAIADALGVSARTVERDLAEVRGAGLPIEVRRGAGGGYRLAVRAKPEPIAFSAGEVAALIASVVAVGPYTSGTAVSALRKLRSALVT